MFHRNPIKRLYCGQDPTRPNEILIGGELDSGEKFTGRIPLALLEAYAKEWKLFEIVSPDGNGGFELEPAKLRRPVEFEISDHSESL